MMEINITRADADARVGRWSRSGGEGGEGGEASGLITEIEMKNLRPVAAELRSAAATTESEAKGETPDLFIAIKRYNFCVLQRDAETGDVITRQSLCLNWRVKSLALCSFVNRAMGDVSDRTGCHTDNGQLPPCRFPAHR